MKTMKDLRNLTDTELIYAYKEADAQYEADRLMGNYGFDAEVYKAWSPVFDAFEEEFERREISDEELK